MLEAIWRTGSATAAAEDLHVSHSAISHHISNLEHAADVTLFRREGRRSVLTPAGQALGRVLNESFIAIAHELDMLAMRERAPLMISASSMVISGWLLPRIEAFQNQRPELSVHFSPISSDVPLPEGIDIAIQFARNGLLPPGSHALFSGRAIPVATPIFLERHPITDLLDIASAPAVHDEDSRMWKLWYKKAGIPLTAAAPPHLYSSQASLMLDLVLSGSAIGLCREKPIEARLKRGELTALSDIGIDDEARYFLQKPKEHSSRICDDLVRFLLTDTLLP